ncbi:MAG: Ig-like domain-containing protein, partial [Endozoicomonas sp.]
AGEEEDGEVNPEEGERESEPSTTAESNENENAEGSEAPTGSALNEQLIIEREDSTSEGPGSVEEADQENDKAQQRQSTIAAKRPLPTKVAQTIEIESQSFSVDENVLSDGSVVVGSVNAQTQGAKGALTYAITGGNDEGKFSVDPQSGDILVVGELDHELTNSFDLTVQATGVGGVSESAQVLILVNNLNEAPDANEDSGTTDENVTLILDVLANDTDVDLDDDSRNFSIDAAEVVDGNGDPVSGYGSVSIVNNRLVFNPGADFEWLSEGAAETVKIRYSMSDDSGAISSASVTVNITGTNDRPVAEWVTAAAIERGGVISGSFSATDLDIADSHSFSIVTPPSEGTVTNHQDGTFSFDPGDRFQDLAEGETREVTFTYVAVDNSGTRSATSNEQSVTITVTGSNNQPVAELICIDAVEDGSVVIGRFSGADEDRSDTLSFAILTQPGEGTVSNNNDGTFSFDPGSAFQDLAEGESREVSFTYVAMDDSGTANDTSEEQIVTITVTGTNDQPEISQSISEASNEDAAPFTVNLLDHATDADNSALLS